MMNAGDSRSRITTCVPVAQKFNFHASGWEVATSPPVVDKFTDS